MPILRPRGADPALPLTAWPASALPPAEAIALAAFAGFDVLPAAPPPAEAARAVLPAAALLPAPEAAADGPAPAAGRAADLPVPGEPAGPRLPACTDLPAPAMDDLPAPLPAAPGPADAAALREEDITALVLLADPDAGTAPEQAAPARLGLLLGAEGRLVTLDLAALATLPPAAPEDPPRPAGPGDIEAALSVTASFWGGFRAELTLTARRAVSDWEVLLESGWTIRHATGATLHAPEAGGRLRLEDAGWNGALAAGQSVTIGLLGATGQAGVAEASAILDALWIV